MGAALPRSFTAACDRCGRSFTVRRLEAEAPAAGPLLCPACGSVVARVNVADWADWVAAVVQDKAERQRRGDLRTRKQSAATDRDIDRDGLFAELAACLMLCPPFVDAWAAAAEAGVNNRGQDLRTDWTGLPRPVEVKHTRHHSPGTGYLIVRPPSGGGREIRVEHIDDALYVLLTGTPPELTLLGWVDRPMLIARGRRNPVPAKGRQRETWGLHWFALELPDVLPFPSPASGRPALAFKALPGFQPLIPRRADGDKEWELTVSPAFLSDLARLPSKNGRLIAEKIEDLQRDPRPDGAARKRVTSHPQPVCRARTGDYRVFYKFGEGWIRLVAVRLHHDGYDDESLGYQPPEAVPPPARPDPAQPPTASTRPLPRAITTELLDAVRVPAGFHAGLLGCRDEDALLAVGLPEDDLGRLLDALYPPAIDTLIDEPQLVVNEIEDLARYADDDLSLTDFLLKLHPEQEKVVDWASRGPLLVKGGPGTGKSLTMMYRVRAVLRAPSDGPRSTVLFSTYTKSLIGRSRQLLGQFLGPDLGRQVTIVNVDKLAPAIAQRSGRFVGQIVLRTADLLDRLRAGKRKAAVPLDGLRKIPDRYLLDEIKWVIEGRGLSAVQEYLDTSRAGRGVPLLASQREQVWAAYQGFVQELELRKEFTLDQVRLLAREAVRTGQYDHRYDHVFIDEVQDLSPVGIGLLVELCRTPEAVCLAADVNQSLYARGFGWQQVHEGLRFQGRTIHLKRGYRTTREIGRAAAAFLGRGGAGDADSLNLEDAPAGGLPTVYGYQTPAGHVRGILNFLNSARLRVRVRWSGAAVLCPTNADCTALAILLRQAQLPARVVTGDSPPSPAEEVSVMTIHSSKGLEFPVVVVAGLQRGSFPRSLSDASREEQAEEDAAARRTFFVAATRAMRELLATYPLRAPSPIIAELDRQLWRRSTEE